MNIISKISLITFLIISISCTTNPFSDKDEIQGGKRTITGIIELDDQQNYENIYVWLETFDIGTFTNEHGSFALSLPSPQSQPGGGVTGVYNLYFYMVNYKIMHAEVVINDGEFLYNEASINKKGEINGTIVLDKLLNVKTTVYPPEITADYSRNLEVTISLKAIDSPVEISVFIGKNDKITGFFVREEESQNDFIDLYVLTNAHLQTKVIGTATLKSETTYIYHQCELPKGNYEIVPFIWVNQPGIPEELINNFVPFPIKMTTSYLNLPFKRTKALVKIDHCDHHWEDPD